MLTAPEEFQTITVVAVGVHNVMVALLSEKADIQYYPGETDPEKLVRAIKDLGFGADLVPEQENCQQGMVDITVSQWEACLPWGDGMADCQTEVVSGGKTVSRRSLTVSGFW